MLSVVLNKPWKQHPTKTAAVQPLLSHHVPIKPLYPLHDRDFPKIEVLDKTTLKQMIII